MQEHQLLRRIKALEEPEGGLTYPAFCQAGCIGWAAAKAKPCCGAALQGSRRMPWVC